MFNLKVFLSVLYTYIISIFAWLCNIFIGFFSKFRKKTNLVDSKDFFINYDIFTNIQFVLNMFKSSKLSSKLNKVDIKESNNLTFDILQSAFSKVLFFKSFKKKFNINFDEIKFLFYMRYSFFINESFFIDNLKIYRNNLLVFDDRFYNDFYILYNLFVVFFYEFTKGGILFERGSFILFLSNFFLFIQYIIKRIVILLVFNLFFKFVSFINYFVNYFIMNYKKLIIFDYIIMLFYAIFYMFYIWIVLLNNFFFRFCLFFKLNSIFSKLDYMNDFFFSKFSRILNDFLFGWTFKVNQNLTFNWGDLFVKNEIIFMEYAGGLKRTYFRLTSEENVGSIFCFWLRRQNFFFITASPWPFLVSMFVVLFMGGFVLYFNYYTSSYYLYLGLFLIFVVFSLWCRDFIRELILNENYSVLLFQNFKVGFWLFIVSEFMLFFSFFWALFHSSFEVSIYLGMQWPPMDGVNINSIKIPFMNTILLVCSGLSLTAAQFGLVAGRLTVYRVSFLYTVFHAVCFLISQLNEYMIAFQQANDSIYGSTMYMLTAFHGMHVFIGLCFLFVCFVRAEYGHMRANDILGFILAGWYWHFVDVVWIGVFLSVYVYGTLYPFILPINFEDIKLYEIRAFI